MLLEQYDWGLDARKLQILFALGLGLVLGIAAQITRFCLRRAIAPDAADRGQAGAVWLTALAASIVGFFAANAAGFVTLEDHRYLSTSVPVAAIVLGGVMFGAGMMLTRGCASRLTVLAATGNLRAVTVLLIFAVVAHATLKGVLSPLRTTIGGLTVDMPFGTLYDIAVAPALLSAAVVLTAVFVILRARPPALYVVLAIVIGLVPVLGWSVTSVLLFDEFDPLAVQSAAFTLPWSDTLFWVLASTAVPAGFGTGLIGAVVLGSFLSASARGELSLQGFETPSQMLRYAGGGVMMGFGGVMAGGCTIGAGLSGSAALSVAAFLALGSIIAGGLLVSLVSGKAPRGVVVS